MQSSTRKTLTAKPLIYRDRPLRWRDLFLTFIPGSLAVLAPFLYGLKRDLYAQSYYGPVAAEAWSWPWYALATVALIPLLILGIRRIRRSHRVVEVHKKGLSIRWTGGKQYRFLWENIAAIAFTSNEHNFLLRPILRRHHLRLYPLVGEAIDIDDHICDLPDLAARIKARIYPRLLPNLRAAFEAGDMLHFGPIAIDKNALYVRRQEIPWEQVSRLNVEAGILVVEFQSRRAIKIPAGKIPNIELLIQLLQEGVN